MKSGNSRLGAFVKILLPLATLNLLVTAIIVGS